MKYVVFLGFAICFTLGYCRNLPESSQNVIQSDQESVTGKVLVSDEIQESAASTCDEGKSCAEEPKVPPQIPQLTCVVGQEDFLWPQTQYQVNHYDNTGSLGVGVGYYGGVLYPYSHPDLLAASNPFRPITALPPVYPAELRDYLSPQTPHGFQRTTRLARSDDEDFLEELAHDAIMPNIIPTMPIPMGRSYENQEYAATASFAGYPQNCAIPVLMLCSPNIAEGILGPSISKTQYKKNSAKQAERGDIMTESKREHLAPHEDENEKQ